VLQQISYLHFIMYLIHVLEELRYSYIPVVKYIKCANTTDV